MSIKEEAYDPGYEDAYGGAYVPGGPEGGQPPDGTNTNTNTNTNGHCNFSAAENTGDVQGRLALLLKPCIWIQPFYTETHTHSTPVPSWSG